jgi:hypothetical protein
VPLVGMGSERGSKPYKISWRFLLRQEIERVCGADKGGSTDKGSRCPAVTKGLFYDWVGRYLRSSLIN